MQRYFYILFICILCTVPSNAVNVSNDVEIKIGINLVSKYVNYGHCVSYENIQPYADFRFGNIDRTGVFGIKPWFSIGHSADVNKKLYMETDIFVYYTTPKKYFTIAYKYVRLINTSDTVNNNDMQIVAGINLVEYVPITFVAITTVYNNQKVYDTKLIFSYDATYKMWEFIPTIGYRHKSDFSYGYIEFTARRNIILSEKVGMFVQMSLNVNSYKIEKSFTYQKNINGWLICGFIF